MVNGKYIFNVHWPNRAGLIDAHNVGGLHGQCSRQHIRISMISIRCLYTAASSGSAEMSHWQPVDDCVTCLHSCFCKPSCGNMAAAVDNLLTVIQPAHSVLELHEVCLMKGQSEGRHVPPHINLSFALCSS